MRVLLVEDEVEIVAGLKTALGRQDIVLDHAPNLAIAEEAILQRVHDAVILDRKLPDGDGLSIIPAIRLSSPSLPIIILSALGSLDHRVAGLDHGADDYLTKPFSADELLARLRAVMRRPSSIGTNAIKVGRLRFDTADRQADIDGKRLDLPRRQLLALEILMRRAGRTVARSALEEAVYGYDDEIASNTLDAHISRLRRKLVPAGIEIHGIRGLGYLLRASE